LGCGLVSPVAATDYTPRGLVVKPFSANVCFRALMLFPAMRGQSRIVRDCVEEFKKVINEPGFFDFPMW